MNKKESKKEAEINCKQSKNNNKDLIKSPLSKINENDRINMNDIVGLAWGAKEILRDDFKKTEWGKIILPFIVLRRLGRVLEPTKDKVVLEYKKIENEKPEYVEARLNKITGYQFHNHTKFNLENVDDDDRALKTSLHAYRRGFSENVKDIFENFAFENTVNQLHKHDMLLQIVERFTSSELDFDPKKIDNHMMGTIYEEVVRKANEATNEEAGHHFTPREVIKLMVNLLFLHEKDSLIKKGIIRTIYDPAAGTGGMLSIASDYIEKINSDAIIDVYGEEINEETYAVCKSDMLIKGLELDRIIRGNSLIMGKNGDGFPDSKFHYMLSNPPFGVDWGKYAKGINKEAEKGLQGKYGAGLPRKSDGSLLFLMHMISKMKPKEEGGSRIAIVLNASPLFSGDAGSGESNIRKWIIEHDMLETIVGLPNDMFYNTGIKTYIWIVTNNKDPKRKGKIQLINATSDKFFKKLKSSLGKKRNFINDIQIENISEIYNSFKEDKFSKIFDNDDFAYTKITVERPLRRSFEISKERLQKLEENAFQRFDEYKEKPKQPKSIDIVKVLSKMPTKVYKNFEEFSSDIQDAFLKSDFKITKPHQKTIGNIIAEKDENANVEKDSKGNRVADSDLRDTENVTLKDDIDKYFAKEILPYASDAWIDVSKNKKGYEIPFTFHFYEYKPLRALEDIDKEIHQLQKEISEGLDELMAE